MMATILQPVYSCMLEFLCLTILLLTVFDTRRGSMIFTMVATLPFIVPMVLLITHVPNRVVGIPCVILIYIIVCRLLYKANWGYATLVCCLFMAFSTVIEMAVTQGLLYLLRETMDSHTLAQWYIIYSICKLVQVLVLCLFSVLWLRKNRSIDIQVKYWLPLLCVPAATIFAMHALWDIGLNHDVTIVALALFAIDILVFLVVAQIAEQNRKTQAYVLAQQRLEMQEKANEAMLSQFSYSRSLLHDIKNHHMALAHLLQEGAAEEALQYSKTVMQLVDLGMYKIKTHNTTVDAILNEKYHRAMQNGIEFLISTNGLQKLEIDPYDLVTILGNILDNAIEACEKCEGAKKLTLQLLVEEGQVFFSVKNSAASLAQMHGGLPTTTKQSGVGGYGLKNVQAAVEKYSGTLDLYPEENEFAVVVRLELGEKVPILKKNA